MKTFIVCAAMAAGLGGALANADEVIGAFGPIRPDNVGVNSLPYNEGKVMCTAAINSDGTRGGGLRVGTTSRSSTGKYNVVFNTSACTNVTAANGYARWAQVDSFGTGTISGITCSTADMAGNTNGVTVNCTNGSGTHIDTSFFLFVTR